MRQANPGRRPRGRPNRKHHMSPRSQTFDSNGPDVRVRGNAHQVYEKYLALARDANSSGDRIAAEGFFQFAEHYFRVLNDSTDPQPHGRPDQRRDRQDRPPQGDGDGATRAQPGPDGAALADTLPPPAESEGAATGNGAAEEASDATAEEAAPAPKPRRGRPRRRTAAKANGADESGDEGESKRGEDAEAATT